MQVRKVILEEWLSLDGFAADGDGRLDYFPSTEANKFSDRDQLAFLDSVDTILLGRRTYELFVEFWPSVSPEQEIIAERLNSLPKIVFSNTLRAAPWGEWPPARVVSGDAVAEIRRLKEEDGKHMVLWGSISLAQQLIVADVIDEYHIQICPTILGAGRALFPALREYAHLERKGIRTYDTGVVFVEYEPRKRPPT
jgi:dihydrofolate reductase